MSEKWTARHGRIQDPHGCTRVVECRGAGLVDGDETARVIAERLNGPSPAEVVTMLRSVEWVNNECPSCGRANYHGGHEPNCKLAAMIKQCEGA